MVDRRENESGGQALITQLLQSIEKGVKPSLESLDDAVVPIIRERVKMPKRGGELGFSKNLSNL